MINQNADFENPKAEIQCEFGETIHEPLVYSSGKIHYNDPRI